MPHKPKFRKDGKPRESTTGGLGKRTADMGNWRVKLKLGRLKLDDNAKQTFLDNFSKTNHMALSAKAAGVTYNTIRTHLLNDPEFSEAFEEARLEYRDRCLSQAQKLIFEGVDEPIIGGKDRDKIIAHKKRYSEILLQMELRKVDPDYKERQELDVKANGGVLLAPAGMTPADWIAEQQRLNAEKIEPKK